MPMPLRVLIVEDNPDDAELMILHLKEAGFQPDCQRVETEAAYLAALEPPPSLILSDWRLPHFNGLRALQLLTERGLNIPFIIVSGSIGEETAIDALRQGADDYVLKDRPARLGQSAKRALEDNQLREERKRAEEALRESQEQFRIAQEMSPDGFTILQPVRDVHERVVDFTWVYENAAVARLNGTDPEAVVGKRLLELFPGHRGTPILRAYQQVAESGEACILEADYSGESMSKPTSFRIVVVPMAGNVAILTQDITERKQAEMALAVSEASYRGLFNGVGEAIYVQDRQGRFLDVNSTAERMYGYARETLIGKTPLFVAAPGRNDLDQLSKLVERAFAGEPQRFEFWGKRANGEIFPKEVRLVRGIYHGQDVIIASADDITERKRAEESLRLQSSALNATANAIVITDNKGVIEWVNPAFTTFTGYAAQEAVGKNPRELVKSGEQGKAFYKQMWDTILAGKIWQGQLINRRKDDSLYNEEQTITPIQNADGSIGHFIAIKQDITERKQAEEALQASEERYRAYVQNSSEAIWCLELEPPLDTALTLEGQVDWLYEHALVVECNEAMAAMHKYRSREEMIGLRLGNLLPRLSRDNLHLVQDFIRAGYRISGRESIELSRDVDIRYFVSSLTGILEGSALRRVWGGQQDVTEQRQAEQSLRESEDRFRDLIEHSHDLIGTHDLNGQILSINPATTGLLGIEPQAIMKMNLIDLLVPETRGQFKDYLAAIQRDGKASGIMLVQTASGEERIWEYDNTLRVEGVSRPVVRALARDVTERVRAEKKIKNYSEQLAAAGELGRVLASSLDQDEIKRRLALGVQQLLPDVATIFISRFDPQKKLITAVYGSQDGEPIDVAELPPMPLSPPGEGTQSEVIRSGQPLIVADLQKKLTGKPVVKVGSDGPDTQSAVYVPLRSQDQTLGVIQVQSYTPNRFTETDVELLTLVGNTAAVATQNAELFEATKTELVRRRQRERELEALATVSAAMRTAPRRAEMLPVILDQLLAQLSVEGTVLQMLDPSSGELTAELGRGVWDSLTGVVIPPGEGVSAQVLEGGQPYLNNDVRGDSRLFRPDAFGECRAAAAAPLKVQEKVIGALWIGSQRLLDNHDLNLLTSIADIAANAIHRAALHEETETRLGQLAALRTIDQTILGSLDKNFTLKIISEQGLLQLKADAVGVLLLNSSTFTFEHAAGSGFRTREIEHAHVRLGEGQAGRSALERHTLSLPDITAEATFSRAKLITDEGFISYHVTPMIAKGKVVGVLEVFHRTRFTPDADWLNFLETLAGQAALTIENAALFDGLQRSNTELSLAYDAAIEGWSRAMDLRDKETEGHTLRVTELSLQLARAMGISPEQMIHMRRGALLHDMGKMGVPDHILLKPGKLTEEEWELMHKHPQFAYDMLSPIPYLRQALDIPYYHHEKWDGTGYPHGWKGELIPLVARIFAVVDVWDAVTSDRPYRAAWSKEKALDYIREQSGKHFDPLVVEAFLELLDAA